MTDKEQIMIDGVDISKCICCLRICTTTKKPEAICNEYAYCSQTPNCYFKQLARKTQECEELKRKVELMMDCPDCKVDEYKKALGEIEKQCKCFGRSKYTQEFDREYGGELNTNVLDIIDKLKDANDGIRNKKQES